MVINMVIQIKSLTNDKSSKAERLVKLDHTTDSLDASDK